MKSFLSALLLTLFAANAQAALKAHYGHYYATGYGDNVTTDIQHLCGKKGVTGINYRITWANLETSDGVFADTVFDNVISTISGMGVPSGGAPNNQCKLWLFVETKLFQGSNAPVDANGDHNPCPLWLTASDGSPGRAANVDTTNTVTIAGGAGSVTNATPIKITTSAAHGLSTNDVVFVDNVAGNTAANGRWLVTKVDSTSFTLQGSNGNGARTGSTGKVASGTVVYTCKVWDSTVITKFNAVIDHLATKYDGNAVVEGMQFEESALGLNNAYAQDSAFNPGSSAYTGALWTSTMSGNVARCGTKFPNSRCMQFLNQINGNQKGLYDVSAALSALPNNQGCYSGPDILPGSANLYNGLNQTYQVLIRHVGCRANSAQNTTINSACGANCNAIFQFAVQGTFGLLSTSSPLPPDQGLCINSYIFWNDSTSEQIIVDPTIQLFPYGNQWYGQCNCGGGVP